MPGSPPLTLGGDPVGLAVVEGAAGQGLGIELSTPAGLRLAGPQPARLRLRRRDGLARLRAAGYASVEHRANGLRCLARLAVGDAGGVQVEFEDHYRVHGSGAGIVLQRRVSVRGADPAWTGFATELELGVPGDGRWFAPGAFYQRNQHAPAGAIGAAGTRRGGVRVREDRLALPLLATFAPEGGGWAALVHLAADAATVEGDDLAADLTAAGLAFGAFGDPGGQVLSFAYPGSEEPVSYPPMWTLPIANRQADSPVNPFPDTAAGQAVGGPTHRHHPLADGQVQRYRLLLAAGQAPAYASFQRQVWRGAFAEYRPRPRPARLRDVELASLELLAGYVTRDGDGDAAPVGIPTWVDCFGGRTGRLQDTFSAGTVGRNLEVAQVLAVGAEREGRPDWRRLAEDILRFWVRHSGDGLSHTDYDRRGRRWTDAGPAGAGTRVFLRDESEAHLAALRCYAHEAAHGRDHLDWLAWCLAYGDWLVEHRTPGGLLARGYRLDGSVADPSEHDGVHAVTFLAELAAVTADPGYLEAAVELGRRYWRRFHARDVFVGGTLENPNCCDREAGTVALEAYLALFAATGDGAWVAAARRAADFVETWLLCWEVPMTVAAGAAPAGPVFFDPSASPVGLSLVTLGFSAVDTYLSRHVGDLLRLGELTGDPHYTDLAGLVLHNTKQMVQRGREFGYAKPGFQIEHWSIGRGRGYGLNSGWLPWVSTSHLLGIWSAEGRLPPDAGWAEPA